MIGWLKGRIIDKQQPGKLVLDVQGVGYDLETSLQTFFKLESATEEVGLHIHTVVREDAFLLYGFLEKEERSLFRALIKVNGVGPKSAISLLSSTTPSAFVQCIHQKNWAFLTSLPGIGKKTAERLVVEMQDSIQQLQLTADSTSSASVHLHQEEAIHALASLGYKPHEVSRAIKQIDDGQKTTEQIIRLALQYLSKGGI